MSSITYTSIIHSFYYFMYRKENYDNPSHSKRRNFTASSSSPSDNVSSSSSFSISSSSASSPSVSLEKSKKHNGGNKTHHQLAPFPSPIVMSTASYSPAG